MKDIKVIFEEINQLEAELSEDVEIHFEPLNEIATNFDRYMKNIELTESKKQKQNLILSKEEPNRKYNELYCEKPHNRIVF